MKSGKGHQEEEEDVYEDFVTQKDAPPPTNNTKGEHYFFALSLNLDLSHPFCWDCVEWYQRQTICGELNCIILLYVFCGGRWEKQ